MNDEWIEKTNDRMTEPLFYPSGASRSRTCGKRVVAAAEGLQEPGDGHQGVGQRQAGFGVPESAAGTAAQHGAVFAHGGGHVGPARAARDDLHSKLLQAIGDAGEVSVSNTTAPVASPIVGGDSCRTIGDLRRRIGD